MGKAIFHRGIQITKGLDEIGKVIYANSITLTPGTVSVEVNESSIRVHALLASTRSDLEGNSMRDMVVKYFPAR